MLWSVLKYVAVAIALLLIILWLWAGGASAIVRFVKTIPNPIDIIWGNSTSTYQVLLPWQIPIPQGPDISGLVENAGDDTSAHQDQLNNLQEQYNQLSQEAQKRQVSGVTSPYANAISLSASAASESNPSDEFLIIESRGGGAVSLTNWSLMSMLSGVRVFLPAAAAPYIQGAVNGTRPVSLTPGGTVIVTTGASPLGVSFQENKCTGYLSQHQSYEPSLQNACPSAPDLMPLTEQNLKTYGEQCVDYVRSIPQCTFPSEVPASLSSACKSFIINNLSYNGCINAYQGQSDFAFDTWHLYLGYGKELWNNRHDVIRLLDEAGRTVDSVTY